MPLSLREKLFGKTTSREFLFNGVKIELRALTEKENTEVWSQIPTTAPASSIRTPILARALVSIDGQVPSAFPDIDNLVVPSTEAKVGGVEAALLRAVEAWLGSLTVAEIDKLFTLYAEVVDGDQKRVTELKKV